MEKLKECNFFAYGLNNTNRQSISFCAPCCGASSNTKIVNTFTAVTVS
jgi:hypothetical protein